MERWVRSADYGEEAAVRLAGLEAEMGGPALEGGEGLGVGVEEFEGIRGFEEALVELRDEEGVVHEVNAEDGAAGGGGAGEGISELFGD
ncbi:MAG: hypothetical protein HY821_20150 [Acidobacteria bacterium]|nr:hypothetical protein [Acidobacteriota bacterium]